MTGGGAWAKANLTLVASTGATQRETQSFSGWTVGAGWEYALPHNLSLKAEYLYLDLGTSRFFDPPFGLAGIPHDVKLRDQIFRIGLNYRFGWGKSPVVTAAY